MLPGGVCLFKKKHSERQGTDLNEILLTVTLNLNFKKQTEKVA